jgi:putative SOS response-associated peptidase YedK
MCGRFTDMVSWRELVELYQLTLDLGEAPNREPRYNIAPTQQISVIVRDDAGERRHRTMRWGLVPVWWKKPLKAVPSTFNARAETVATSGMFRSAFKARRCLIPASGFYEWTGDKKARQPHYITATDGGPLTFAGLHEFWRDPGTGDDVLSATIITTEANRFVSTIHDRMPVILSKDNWQAWLDKPREDLLKPAPEDVLQEWPVTPKVNSNRYQDADAIEPIAT